MSNKWPSFNRVKFYFDKNMIDKNKYVSFYIFIIFWIGIIIGSFITYKLPQETYEAFCKILKYALNPSEMLTLKELFFNSIKSMIIYLIVLFFCGYCTISKPIIMLITLVSGVGYGLKTVSRFSYYTGKNDIWISIIISVLDLLNLFVILFSCKDAIIMSKSIMVKSLTNANSQNQQTNNIFNKYIAKFILYFLIISLIVFSKSLISYFTQKY